MVFKYCTAKQCLKMFAGGRVPVLTRGLVPSHHHQRGSFLPNYLVPTCLATNHKQSTDSLPLISTQKETFFLINQSVRGGGGEGEAGGTKAPPRDYNYNTRQRSDCLACLLISSFLPSRFPRYPLPILLVHPSFRAIVASLFFPCLVVVDPFLVLASFGSPGMRVRGLVGSGKSGLSWSYSSPPNRLGMAS
jgi:hypothetical protein